MMKKLIYFAALLSALASCIPAAGAEELAGDIKTPHLIHSSGHPTGALTPVHHFELQIAGGALSQLSIEFPEGLSLREGIAVADDRSGQTIDATVSVTGRKHTISFSRPVPSGTVLSISLNGIKTSDYLGRTWLYPISGRLVGMRADIPFGTGRIQTYN
ncbi:MAG: hypothetical protein KME26_16390 [Oscillatoria princeps RMCB-10]|jgi:hypothetical protein|nr:hypothetical protein [Oscillatoria princeps RMCB-10]